MTYREAIAEGRRLYKEAMDKAANYALYVSEEFNRPLQTVCKEMAGDGWQALRAAARRLQETAGQTVEERGRALKAENARKAQHHAKAVLKDPNQAAKVLSSLSADALDTVYQEARLARAGQDRSPAARKAATAAAHTAGAPIRRAIATMSMDLAIQAQKDAGEDLREAMAEEAITPAKFAQFEKAHNETAEIMAEVRFSLPARA